MTVVLCSNMLSGRTGLDKSVVLTANSLARAGYDVTVLNFLGSAHGAGNILPRWPFDQAIPVLSLKTLAPDSGSHLATGYHAVMSGRIGPLTYSISANELAALAQINRLLSVDDTIIFTHPLQAAAFATALGAADRRPRTMLQIHGDYPTNPELMALTLQARHVIDAVQTVASGMNDEFTPTFGTGNVHWIPNIHEPSEIPRRSHSTVDIVVVGSFQERKNQLDAVRAFAHVPDPSARLVFWGADANPYGAAVRALVAKLGQSDRVVFAGLGSERDIYSSADIVLMPSLSEGFPYVLTEAACAGLPIVAYDFDFGPRDIIDHGVSGFLAPVGDVEALAHGLTQLAADSTLRAEFGGHSREAYGRLFSVAPIVERYRQVLGPATSSRIDLVTELSSSGPDPLAGAKITHRKLTMSGTDLHLVTITGGPAVRRVVLDDGHRRRGIPAPRAFRATNLIFRAARARNEVISYSVGSEPHRHYLGNTNSRGELEVLRFLREAPAAGRTEVDRLSLATGATPGYRVLSRDPRHPVTSGIDSFGDGIGTRGGVDVRNAGSAVAPTLYLAGEYDWVDVRCAGGSRRVSAPWTYRELFDLVCSAERELGLNEWTTADGVRAWELYRASFLSQVAESVGMWGRHFTAPPPVRDVYGGTKSLNRAPQADRVVFEFPRKVSGSVDRRTQAFADPGTIFVEYPQSDGYSTECHRAGRVFPIYEYNVWRRSSARPAASTFDTRPLEKALSSRLGVTVEFGSQLNSHVQKFLDEREFWAPVFARIAPSEVIIPSSYWSAGICAAARSAGAVVSDIQIALTGAYHPTYWFGAPPQYSADRFYAWSDVWADRTNAYSEAVVVPRFHPELSAAMSDPGAESAIWDVCVVSQPRISRRIVHFLEELVHVRPELRVVVAPHPDEHAALIRTLEAHGTLASIDVAPNGTFDALLRSRMVVGGYSTSLYEAAALGRPTFVLPVPGHEILLEDVRRGHFRLAHAPEDVVPFDVPASSVEFFAQ